MLLPAVALAAAGVWLLVDHAHASGAVTYASYPALEASGPTGLSIVTSEQQARETTGPVLMAPAAGAPRQAGSARPEVASIRKVEVGVPGALVWVAKSLSGGVCVLASTGVPLPNGHVATASSCSTSGEGLLQGATVELSGLLTGSPGRVLSAGVLPSGVSSLSAVLADGSKRTLSISDGGWAMLSESAPVEVEYSRGGTVHQIELGGR